MNPANDLSKVVFPMPFAPVSTSASPRLTANESPSMTRRDPRSMTKSSAISCTAIGFRDERTSKIGAWMRKFAAEATGFLFLAGHIKGRLYPSLAQKRGVARTDTLVPRDILDPRQRD